MKPNKISFTDADRAISDGLPKLISLLRRVRQLVDYGLLLIGPVLADAEAAVFGESRDHRAMPVTGGVPHDIPY